MPFKTQMLFAKRWLWNVAFWGCPLCVGVGFAIPIYLAQKGFILAIMTGAFAGVLISYFVLRGFYHVVASMNGAPFQEGDIVQILIGEYQGQVGSIYEKWKDRKQVRVDLGEQAMKDLKDIFSYNEICRSNQQQKDGT